MDVESHTLNLTCLKPQIFRWPWEKKKNQSPRILPAGEWWEHIYLDIWQDSFQHRL